MTESIKTFCDFHPKNFTFITCIILCIFVRLGHSHELPKSYLTTPSKWTNNEEIKLFREYLRIPTVHPNVDYRPAVEFLKKQAISLDLPVAVHYPADEENPVVVMTWEGSQPELPTILLNSHMDVVQVFEEYWTHPPFGAEMDENGDIFARGAQDMKYVGMEYLAAIRALKRSGLDRLKRTIHVIFVPDEEMGGKRGMKAFCKSDAFEAMNVGFALDEGGAAIDDDGTLPAYYIEKTLWRMEFIFHGQSGHGSEMLDDTAGEKLIYVLNKLNELRKEEKMKLKRLKYPSGNVTSINITILKGGVAKNIIPPELSATVDMRVSANADFEAFKQQINRWCKEAGENITINTFEQGVKEIPTIVDDSNPFWVALKNGVREFGYDVVPMILPATTDMRFLREMNISAIGIASMMNTEHKMHGHNEFLNAETFLKGIELHTKIISNLGNS